MREFSRLRRRRRRRRRQLPSCGHVVLICVEMIVVLLIMVAVTMAESDPINFDIKKEQDVMRRLDDASLPTQGELSFGTAGGKDETVLSGTVDYFNDGDEVPSGMYRIEYVDGCMKYSSSQSWTINARENDFRWWVVTDTETPDKSDPGIKLPGTRGFMVPHGYHTFRECIDANTNETKPVYFEIVTSMVLGIWLEDRTYAGTYGNVAGPNGRSPKWELIQLLDIAPSQAPSSAPALPVMLHPDIVYVKVVEGVDTPKPSWKDSYSVGNKCYCKTNFDDGLADMVVDTGTLLGTLSIKTVCQLLGKGPGKKGRPVYNDVQCGNGPPSRADNGEVLCPGRVDIGSEGCGQIGPKWDFTDVAGAYAEPTSMPSSSEPTSLPPTHEPTTSNPSSEPTPLPTPVPSTVPLTSLTLHPDIVKMVDVPGTEKKPKPNWRDSYSVGGECYCITTFDDGLDTMAVDTGTSLGTLTIREVCALLGPGPGKKGRPLYNDIQCGNGPPAVDDGGGEMNCPGRVDLGYAGCGMIGPTWNFSAVFVSPTWSPTPQPTWIHPDIVKIIDVVGEEKPKGNWRDSYSVGNRCYCDTRFDHNIGPIMVETPLGNMTVKEACKLIGDGPGRQGNPVYNDVQCGNGPANDAGDEETCPGRTDIGKEGCGHIGPLWNFDDFLVPSVSPSQYLSAMPSDDSALIRSSFDDDTDGFVYMDDPFNVTRVATYADTFATGSHSARGGIGGTGALRVELGGVNGYNAKKIAGGYYNSFDVTEEGPVVVKFSYRVVFSPDYDDGEYSQVLCMVDGELIGRDGQDYVDMTNGESIKWTTVILDVGTLSPGSYVIAIGGHNNQKNAPDESTHIYFDNLVILPDVQ